MRTNRTGIVRNLICGGLLFVLAAPVYPLGQNALQRAHVLRREYRFEEAMALLDSALERDRLDTNALTEKARTLQAWHKYESAAAAWQTVLALDSTNVGFWKERWNCLWGMTEDRSLDTARTCETIRHEGKRIARALKQEDRLALLALSSQMSLDTTGQVLYRDSLVQAFPEDETGYEMLGEAFYDSLYPIWDDAEKKITYCEAFVNKYPRSYWRNVAYRFLLSACNDLERRDSLLDFAERWMNEDEADPLPFVTAASWCVQLDTLPAKALEWSQKALELSRTYHLPEAMHSMQRAYEEKRQWLAIREGLLWSLWKTREYEKAASEYAQSIAQSPLDTEDDLTLCGVHVLGGWNSLSRNDTSLAESLLVEALIAGDSRNIWTAKADSTLRAIGVATPVQLARDLENYDGPIFRDVTEEAGLKGYNQSRVAWGDYDNDGDDDLLLSGSVLLRNENGIFINVTESVGLTVSAGGGVWADYDNDDRLDFYAIGGGDCGDRLWHGLPDGTFEDATEKAGMVCDSSSSEGAAWADADNDGFLDLYVANYEKPGSLGGGTPDILYVNQRDGTFRRETADRGMIPPWNRPLCGRGVAWCDWDRDGDEDCYVSDYRLQENLLFQNNGKGEFYNIAPHLHLNGDEVDGWFGHTIGSEWGDFDNDGDFDLICANLAHPRYIEFSNKTMLYENPGDATTPWQDRRAIRGIKYEETHSDPAWGDVDGDGDLDLFITSIYQNRRSFLYRNDSGHFMDITYLAGVRALNGWGCAFSDYDGDGDLDLVVGSGSGVRLFRNETNPRGWLEVKVLDMKGNRAAIGMIIELEQGSRKQLRQIQGGKGTTSQQSLVQYFGGLDEAVPAYLSLDIPGDGSQTYKLQSFNRRLTISVKAVAGRKLH
jgi:tetratricopeptide (TPR) repeat protein